MATVSLKVNAAISATATRTSTGTSNIYTAPDNGYAIINVYVSSSNSAAGSVNIGGLPVININTPTGQSRPNLGDAGSWSSLYVGPSQQVALLTVGTPAVVLNISGVEFIN